MQRLFQRAFILMALIVYPLDAMRVTEFKHGIDSACQAVKYQYGDLSGNDAVLLERFRFCCKNKDSLDLDTTNALNEIIKNAAGRETLRIITAKLYPFVLCANTLEALVNDISTTEKSDKNSIRNKARKIVLLFDTLAVEATSPKDAINNICTYLAKLKKDPVSFPAPGTRYKKGSLLRVFGGSEADKGKIIGSLNKLWGGAAQRAVIAFSERLKRGMFSILYSSKTNYEYDGNDKYIINFSGGTIDAPCITGPLCKGKATPVMPSVDKYYLLKSKSIGGPSGLHHELFHHLAIGLDFAEYPSFDRLVKVLESEAVDGSYIALLEEIYTDMDEFRNIIGIFVDDSGNVFFDPCSEAAYLTAGGNYVRATHKDGMTMIRIPIKFVNFVKRANSKMNIEAGPVINRGARFDWI